MKYFLDICMIENSRWGHFNNYQPGKYKQPLTHTKRGDHNGNKNILLHYNLTTTEILASFLGKMCAKTENKFTNQRIQVKIEHKQK